MSNDLPKLVSGNVGPVRFDHMNRVMDATRAVEGAITGAPGAAPQVIRGLWIKLLATSGTVGSYNLWTWGRVGVNSGSSSVAVDTTLIESADFSSGGKAIDVGGNGAVNDIVFAWEMIGLDNVRYFAFLKSVSTNQVYVITSTATDATGSTPSWVYTLTPISGFSAGSWTSSGTTVRARNLAEDQTNYQHGQDLTLSSGTLVPAVVAGPVWAWNTGVTESAVALYAFDVPNPMTVTCA